MVGSEDGLPHGIQQAQGSAITLLERLHRIHLKYFSVIPRSPGCWNISYKVQVDHVGQHSRVAKQLEYSWRDSGPELQHILHYLPSLLTDVVALLQCLLAIDGPQLAQVEGVEEG